MTFEDARYVGRPLLKVLDAYILRVTGHLAPDTEHLIADVVRTAYGGGADWMATTRRALLLPDDIDDRIRVMWARQPAGVDPLAFSRAVSDESFLPLIDPLPDDDS